MTEIKIGDCIESMRTMDAESVQCCITSPPYYGLRDYGHDGQIGLEESPDAYVAKMVELFREVRRVLRDDGTLWLNLGDSYCGGGRGGNPEDSPFRKQATNSGSLVPPSPIPQGLKPKDLIGIPWRVAFALQSDGWYLRQDIIWHKPNPMPESVTDRCTKAHEYIFLLSKSARYFYDAEAIKTEQKESSISRQKSGWNGNEDRCYSGGVQNHLSKYFARTSSGNCDTKANKRSVWTVNTQPYAEAHFATFPEKLITPCVKAGSAVGDTILDPFGGSGTTAVVAEKYGRNAVICELNLEYAEMARKRVREAEDNHALFTHNGVMA
ncbi:MAG: site-specific DNA-methyltransferase [Phycisphaerales bacterium]|nr:site-specific DNA-methyltransferase [Phycisphaerales bacterium]